MAKADVRHQAVLLQDSAKTLEDYARRIKEYAQRTIKQLDEGKNPGELACPPISDFSSAAGTVARHGGKLDLAIELSYYENHPEDIPSRYRMMSREPS